MKQHITRAYNSFFVDASRGTITKKSKEVRLRDEILYYEEMTNNLNSIFFPRLMGSSFKEGSYEMELEYYAYNNLGDYMVYGDFDPIFWLKVASALEMTLNGFADTKKEKDYTSHGEAMYIEKTQKYYTELLKNAKFAAISKLKHLQIDGKTCLNFEYMWDDVQQKIKNDLFPLKQFSIIHGDMCFSNILCGINEKTHTCVLKFVDPRGYFGESGIFGDPLYDYAKLTHSYEGGYEYIIYDQFDIKENSGLNSFEISFANDNKDSIKDIFHRFSTSKARLVEGLIYIGMCSRHYDSEKRQLAMYMTGIKLLNEALVA